VINGGGATPRRRPFAGKQGNAEDVATALSQYSTNLRKGTPWINDVLEDLAGDDHVEARVGKGEPHEVLVPSAADELTGPRTVQVLGVDIRSGASPCLCREHSEACRLIDVGLFDGGPGD
jgi:hypothetical protein